MNKFIQIAFAAIVFSFVSSSSFAFEKRFGLVAGLIQPIVLKGGNVEVVYWSERMSFDYSHGFSLELPASGKWKDQGLVQKVPISTGFGIGYRLTEQLDLRVEPKIHTWEIYYENEAQSSASRIISFTTYSIGLGFYYRILPFGNSTSWIKGITIVPSFRIWPTVASSLADNQFTYTNKNTSQTETLKAPNIGASDTPFILNLSLGYSF